ncbi:SufB/SufD family protein [Pseudaquidulcibacter saccharophilus]|uniref:SufB/SufD family protein n=1 Tax=Pseudaquidulcibacter saccharophilus TaxID=2831900 RepID=UPI001EFF3ECA|nr:SufD family Fe-S cluster assembly protein [Pseudaquidulcibacter saccharophilus]
MSDIAILNELTKTEWGKKAREYIEKNGLPNKRVEFFHYTDLARALSDKIESPSGEVRSANLSADIIIHATQFGEIVSGASKDLQIDSVSKISGYDEDVTTILVQGLSKSSQRITLKAGKKARIAIQRGAGSRTAMHIIVENGAHLEIIEEQGADAGLSSGLMFAEIGENASLRRIMYADTFGAKDIRKSIVNVAKGGEFAGFSLMRGGELSRIETDVHLLGEGAKCNFNAAYLLKNAHNDITTTVYHHAPNCETKEMVRGIVGEGGNAVFQGKIQVERNAQKTSAVMEHRGIMLEDGGKINAKPSLEIYADDVECSHANTIGALDESALFYMQARGISQKSAKILLIKAFLSQVFDDLQYDDIREYAISRIENRLDEIVG